MEGYYEKPEATNEVIKVHADGKRWLHTGDLGYMTEDGIIYVSGRIKRIIMTKGIDGNVTKLFPDRIEKAVLQHPAVGLCCVIGIAHEERIHYPKAFVVLENQQEVPEHLEDEIQAICRKILPDYMVSEAVEIRESLPLTERGKVDYRALERESLG